MRTFYELLCAGEALIARALLIAMVVLIFGAGIARVVGYPINWAIDMATCFFAWACFFSADIAWRNDKLMSVDVFVNSFPKKAQKACRMVNYVILTAFLIYIVGAGLWLSYISRARAFQGIPAISYSWVTLSLPIGGVLLLITTIIRVRKEIRSGWEKDGTSCPAGNPPPASEA